MHNGKLNIQYSWIYRRDASERACFDDYIRSRESILQNFMVPRQSQQIWVARLSFKQIKLQRKYEGKGIFFMTA